MKRATRKTLIAVAVVVVALAAASIGSVMLFISRHVHTDYVAALSASSRTRARGSRANPRSSNITALRQHSRAARRARRTRG
jgi:hypothetical protein